MLKAEPVLVLVLSDVIGIIVEGDTGMTVYTALHFKTQGWSVRF